MHRMLLSITVAAAGLSHAPVVAAGGPVGAARGSFEVISDSEIVIDGRTYGSWDEVVASGYFQQQPTRCRADTELQDIDGALRAPADCSSFNTIIKPEFDPSVARYRIPVVVHVIQRTNGTGFISASRVQSQIDVLNEDFLALPGTNGAPGTDVQVEFYLATEDPTGNPTTGITYSTNNTWFTDGGSYWNTLAWDPDRYLNIYTNDASGALGYVPFLPASSPGSIGANSDRVVVLYSSFGRNAPLVPYHLGRTTTHEVGHYLGLDHTFASGGCPSVAGCAGNGDLICDTRPENSPVFGCPASNTQCSGQTPFHNYMDYSDDICMYEFTPNQANRIRCTLLNYRTQVFTVATDACSPADLDANGVLNLDDVDIFVAAFAAQQPEADLDGNGLWNIDDVDAFIAAYNAGCP